jgi:hypothetical protein
MQYGDNGSRLAYSHNQSNVYSQKKPCHLLLSYEGGMERQSLELQEAYRLQWRSFSGLVYERRHLPGLKALLKLYTSISLPKLASLLDGLDESAVRGQLILLKVCSCILVLLVCSRSFVLLVLF